MSASRPRVVVADDSAFMRRVVADALTAAGMHVAGAAGDGDGALELCRRHRPDVLTLDLTMPGLDGMGVLRALRDEPGSARPGVVVVSAFSPAHGARAVDALAEGAFELVAKPPMGDLGAFAGELREKVLCAAGARESGPATLRPPRAGARAAPSAPAPRRAAPAGGPAPADGAPASRLVLIASSTGGPRALAEVVPALPAGLPAGGLVVQHMPAGFTASLAARLDAAGPLAVREAAGGEPPAAGTVLLAPGGEHLRIAADRRVRTSDAEPVGGLRPRADVTIEDAAALWGRRLVLVVLTGMGSDGLRGARAVRRHGGRVLTEARDTCTVYGMPRAVEEAGLADRVVPLGAMAAAIAEEVGR